MKAWKGSVAEPQRYWVRTHLNLQQLPQVRKEQKFLHRHYFRRRRGHWTEKDSELLEITKVKLKFTYLWLRNQQQWLSRAFKQGRGWDIRNTGDLEGDMGNKRKEWELAHLGPLSRSWDGFKTSAQGLLLCDSCLMK